MERRTLAEHDCGRLKSDGEDDRMRTGVTHTRCSCCCRVRECLKHGCTLKTFLDMLVDLCLSLCSNMSGEVVSRFVISHLVSKKIRLL